MELIERTSYLALLQTQFDKMANGEGHSIFVSGEAGIGKTSLIKAFCKERKADCSIYQGVCDALFTPRPLAPLYDIIWQIKRELWESNNDHADRSSDRTGLFTRVFQELSTAKDPIIIVFEDIHWADEATFDFIKFLARRITHLKCLFLLTYRDDEIHSGHPLRNVMGQLSPDSFTRLPLSPLSSKAVEKMAQEKGYNGEDVYSISRGNPFYVNEILASYSLGVPDNVKDAVLSVYNRQEDPTKYIWELLSILPTGFEIKYLEKMVPLYAAAIERCLDSKILVMQDAFIFFKHELYRRTIESALSPLKRVALNKKILELYQESFEQNGEIERIIHHAKNANDYECVVHFAPLAARKAASLGCHIEASKLYLTAIEYYQGQDSATLIQFYEAYAYECYLTNQIKEAIIYQGKSLRLWQTKNDIEKTGNCLRFLSRLWWFEGNRLQAESFARQAIDVLNTQPDCRAKAMAFSNMSQLKMLAGQSAECLAWGEKAIELAQTLGEEEILAHALNNVGTTQMMLESSQVKGRELLQQSLAIALKNGYHEHVARAYTNLSSVGVTSKQYDFAKKMLQEGIQYCEERDLDSWTTYMLSWKARMCLETGNWKEAYQIADHLLKKANQPPVVKITALVVVATIKLRRGEPDALLLLQEAKVKAFAAGELQRILPTMIAILEYEWLTGKPVIEPEALEEIIKMMEEAGVVWQNSEFAFWLGKVRKQSLPLPEWYEGYRMDNEATAAKAAVWWEKLGCPYEQALALFMGNEMDKKKAITLVHELGALAVHEKMKQELRASGIRNIPRGIRETTRSNPALLTSRELEVLRLLKEGMQNKEIGNKLFISPKTVDHHISAILLKLEMNSRVKAVQEAVRLGILK
ncbi:hypothetical protein AHMF7605_00865 [Adhaeribacter arboris]|uniref:HTH luxR-type domain-containing protein n=1 Tax=Adhaeribacter arboris TaxID=2072846 RepID=A0A2T2Y9I5_9BACT|nr:helix-turn-helix transcriptional regulator [Adhaeribacter arboris]PSR52172.1 hypothetical protein AHMF7605_00865 [Adhaeribacter arboris]